MAIGEKILPVRATYMRTVSPVEVNLEDSRRSLTQSTNLTDIVPELCDFRSHSIVRCTR